MAGIRWLAAAAHAGPGSITLWALAAACFFVPSAMVVATLGSRMPAEGGFYVWTARYFGPRHAFVAGWCYWLSNLFYLPSLLLAGAGIAMYLLGPGFVALAERRSIIVPVTLAILWVAVLANLFGLRQGKWLDNLGGAGTYTAGLLLIGVGAAVWWRDGSATPLTLTPQWDWEKLNFWSQIAFAFGGLELSAVLGGEIRDPERAVRRAAWMSGLGIAFFYIAGTVALLVLMQPGHISVMTGLAQAGAAAGERLGLGWLSPALGLLITLGVAGQLGSWLGGCARLPYVVGLDRHLPPAFARLHPRWQTPHVALLAQGIFCSAVLVLMQAGENLRTGYQLLVDLTIVTYFIPFLYIFSAAWRAGMRLSAASGLGITVLGIVFSLVPPAGAASPPLFVAKLLGAAALLVLGARIWFDRYEKAARPA